MRIKRVFELLQKGGCKEPEIIQSTIRAGRLLCWLVSGSKSFSSNTRLQFCCKQGGTLKLAAAIAKRKEKKHCDQLKQVPANDKRSSLQYSSDVLAACQLHLATLVHHDATIHPLFLVKQII